MTPRPELKAGDTIWYINKYRSAPSGPRIVTKIDTERGIVYYKNPKGGDGLVSIEDIDDDSLGAWHTTEQATRKLDALRAEYTEASQWLDKISEIFRIKFIAARAVIQNESEGSEREVATNETPTTH